MKKIVLSLLTAFLFLSISSYSQLVPGHLYGSTGAVGAALITIDPVSGFGTFVAPHGAFGPVTEITFNPAGNMLYGGTGEGYSTLITIDPVTGIEAAVGVHQFGALNGLEFVGNTLYGTYISNQQGPSSLVIVNPVIAQLTFIGPTGHGPIAGLAYHSASGVLFGITAENTIPSELVAIDLNTGMATSIGPVGVAQQCRGLTFGPNGILYTGTAQIDPNPGLLLSLDPNTGLGTIVGLTGMAPVSGLAYPPIAPIPLPNWPIYLGILLISAFMVFRFRRRLA